MKASFRIWYAVWVGQENTVFVMRRSKKAAKGAMSDARKFLPGVKFGVMRLTQQVPRTKRRKRSRRKHAQQETRKGHLNGLVV